MQLNNLITYLNSIPAITSIVGNRIFWGIPGTEQTQNYMTLNIISETQPSDVEKKNRIEFRYIGGDTSTTYTTLLSLDIALLEAVRNYKGDGVYKSVISNLVNGYDEKQRKVIIRDIIIYWTT